MARKLKTPESGSGGGVWLVTFSDTMMLLLTFFVLLLSMSSMDASLLARITIAKEDSSSPAVIEKGRVPERIQLLLDLMRDPVRIPENKERIKDLLFPYDILPKELPPGTLEENMRILAHPEGVVIVLSEGVLFTPGTYVLNSIGRELLQALAVFLHYTTADVNIAGHTDNRENAPGMSGYELSGRRALSVLEYFLQQNFPASRFSISGYGPHKPLEPNTNEKNRRANRRVEILLKTSQWLGRYV